MNLTFKNPEILILLLGLIPLILGYIFKQKNTHAAIQISSLEALLTTPKTYKYYLRHSLFVLRALCMALLIIILARPQVPKSWREVTTTGIDMIMALDVSTSMLAKDFKPNRLEAAKEVAQDFISQRNNDRIGLVVFSGESFTQFPLTTDHNILSNLINDVRTGMMKDGTAIGLGLANAVRNLKDSKSASKVIILLTDGINNAGSIAPMEAAQAARNLGIRVYTIGIRRREMAKAAEGPGTAEAAGNEFAIDPDMLENIARLTGGTFFSSTDKETLQDVYREIDKLEKSRMDLSEYGTKEAYLPFALLATFLLVLELVLKNTVLRSIP
ncbi:MAG: VWA domain-containing protein [Bacteroidota bacterium]|nr:VWA domain-containing protein [Bacteroidota bacterium]